jgi:NTP pyrophosphatase (non-canonical NTP hydrolase)
VSAPAADGGAGVARRILALAEEERELVHAGRAEDLEHLHARRQAAMAELPEELSDEALSALRHALALQRQITDALRDALAATGAELGRVSHGRAAARGYAPAGLDARRTLDRTA